MEANADSARPQSATLTVERHSDAEVFVALAAEWTALEARAAEDNIFLTHPWQHAWWSDLGGGRTLELLAFRDGGRLVGIAPMYEDEVEGDTVLRFCGGLEVTDYMGLLVERGYEQAVGDAFLVACGELPAVRLDFHFLRSDGLTLRVLTQAAENLGWRMRREEEEVSPRIRLAGDWESYVASLDKKDRHELRRKRRRLDDAGRWEVVDTTAATLAADLEGFFDLHARSTRAKADFLTAEMAHFFRHIAVHLQELGWLSLRTLRFDGRAVASVMGFVYGGCLLLYNSGYDPDLNRLSPGFVLMSEEVRLALEEGLEEVDFLRGNERYKYELGATDLPLVHLALEPAGAAS